MRKISITLSDWLFSEALNQHHNKSDRIQELMIKGMMAERERSIRSENKNVASEISSHLYGGVACGII